MAKKVIKVGDCKFILLKWRDKWVFPLISYYLSGKDSPIYFALFSWNLKEGKFVKETTVTINFPKKPRGFCCQFVDTKNNGSSIIERDWNFYQISFPFIFLYPVILHLPYPFIIAASSILLSGECYSFLSAKFHLRHLYHAKVTILFVAEIFLFTLRKAYFRTKPCR